MDQNETYSTNEEEYGEAGSTNDPAFHPPNTSTPVHGLPSPDNTQNWTPNPREGRTLINPTSPEQGESSTFPPKMKYPFNFTKKLTNQPNATQLDTLSPIPTTTTPPRANSNLPRVHGWNETQTTENVNKTQARLWQQVPHPKIFVYLWNGTHQEDAAPTVEQIQETIMDVVGLVGCVGSNPKFARGCSIGSPKVQEAVIGRD
jgi:hypothetical protein